VIASLRGRLVHKDAGGVIVECGGVGYGVAMSLSALERIGALGGEVHLLTHTHVGQDVLRLYGFLEAGELRAFQILIGISGVGPKLALAILSTFNADELRGVVARADTRALVRVPGVGRKKAERLLLELKDRLPVSDAAALPPGEVLRDDLTAALVDLGFTAAAADRAAADALAAAPGETDLAILVRSALRASTTR